MHTCPKCTQPVQPDIFDPRNTLEVTYCPHCDTRLTHNPQEEAKATIHFFIFVLLTFALSFYIGIQLIASWGNDIALVAIPPILLTLLYLSYKLFSIELNHLEFEEKEKIAIK